MRHARPLTAVLFGAALAVEGCDTVEPLVVARCNSDEACGPNKFCDNGVCKTPSAASCQSVMGGKALLQPSPPVVEFGVTGHSTTFQTLTLRNIGNCTLTIFDASFDNKTQTEFACDQCTPSKFPMELFPLRSTDFAVSFTPDMIGMFNETLVILSDDAEYPEIHIPFEARYDGLPAASVQPDHIDFGYASVGRTLTQQIQIANRGSGTTPLVITQLAISPTGTTAFSFDPEPMPGDPPISLVPLSMNRDAMHVLNVHYHPTEVGLHHGTLDITTNLQTGSVIHVPLTGSSKTPPKISVSPEMITFGDVPIGMSNFQPLTITNEGGSPLVVSYTWGGTGLSTDLSASPAIVPPIQPGSYTQLQTFVTATAPSAISGLLLLATNDPVHPTVTVPVSANGVAVPGAQVVKIDMTYDNGQDGTFDDDLRRVEMGLENPFGLVCDKEHPNPMDWMAFGSPSWIAFGPKEEPQRIVLPNAMMDGTYKIQARYIEDCSSVPSGLLASILGISIDVLIAYFSGGAVNVNPMDISNTIDSICLKHDSSAATITVYLNGQIAAEKSVTLGRKGDSVYAADLIRMNGQFTVQ
jgi:hypothetical protein